MILLSIRKLFHTYLQNVFWVSRCVRSAKAWWRTSRAWCRGGWRRGAPCVLHGPLTSATTSGPRLACTPNDIIRHYYFELVIQSYITTILNQIVKNSVTNLISKKKTYATKISRVVRVVKCDRVGAQHATQELTSKRRGGINIRGGEPRVHEEPNSRVCEASPH